MLHFMSQFETRNIIFLALGRNRSRVSSNWSVALTATPYRLQAEVSGMGNISATDS